MTLLSCSVRVSRTDLSLLALPKWGEIRQGRRREMSVLDGSMVQVQFGKCRTVGVCVLKSHPLYILFGGFFAYVQAPGDGLHWHAGGVELQGAPFLPAERGPVRRIVGREDVGEPPRHPVVSSRY